ncbi:MAG: hypothetical protein H0T18_06390, partial [Chloroflexia bacterium]|nr:hypothetical protein [Chloroflexia bacterium]
MYRTIQNLEFIELHKDHYSPFEVTQLINSFLAVVAHPWDQLLDKCQLEKLGLESEVFRECGFPVFPSLPVEGEPVAVNNAYDLLRILRNGMAHGNMELLDRKELRKLRQTGPLPRVKEDEIGDSNYGIGSRMRLALLGAQHWTFTNSGRFLQPWCNYAKSGIYGWRTFVVSKSNAMLSAKNNEPGDLVADEAYGLVDPSINVPWVPSTIRLGQHDFELVGFLTLDRDASGAIK